MTALDILQLKDKLVNDLCVMVFLKDLRHILVLNRLGISLG